MARYINTTQGINKVNILIDDPVSNTGNTFTVTPIRTWESEKKEITTNELINGLSSSTDRTEISGRLLIGSSRPVATIQIDTISGYYISSEPTISTNFNNNLDFQLRSITKNDDGYITSYVFELFCFIESSIVGSNNLKCTINYVTKVIPTVSSLITNISFGNNIINSQGETRTINIHGTSGSTFGIAINENFDIPFILTLSPTLTPVVLVTSKVALLVKAEVAFVLTTTLLGNFCSKENIPVRSIVPLITFISLA